MSSSTCRDPNMINALCKPRLMNIRVNGCKTLVVWHEWWHKCWSPSQANKSHRYLSVAQVSSYCHLFWVVWLPRWRVWWVGIVYSPWELALVLLLRKLHSCGGASLNYKIYQICSNNTCLSKWFSSQTQSTFGSSSMLLMPF
jgi:hypothetical protein